MPPLADHSVLSSALFGQAGPPAVLSLLSLVVVLAGMQIGRWCRRLWADGGESLWEGLVIGTALGLGILSLVIFALGVLQLYRFTWVLSILLLIAGVWGVAGTVKEYGQNLHKDRHRGLGPWRVLCGVLLGLLFLASLIPAMAPASMSDWDSLAYHLTVPKLYLNHGGIYRIDIMSHSHFPMLVEMLYIPGLALGVPGAGKMVSFWVTVLLVGAVAVMAAKRFGGGSVAPATIALAGMPIVLWEATTGYIDTAAALYTVVAVYLLGKYLDRPARGALIGCGLAAGFAASTKMTGLAAVPLLVLWLLVDRFVQTRRVELKSGAVLASVAVLVCLPWYLKSWLFTGNPVYPFFYSIFGGRGWTAALAQHYAVQQAKFGMGHGLTDLLCLPYDLTFFSSAFYDGPGLYVGPLMLVGAPVLLFARYRSRWTIGLLGFVLASVLAWFALTLQSRYLIPTLALLAVLVCGLAFGDDRLHRARWALVLVFVLTALFGLWTMKPRIASVAPYVLGRVSQDDYLASTIDTYPATRFVNTNLPRDARIALFGDTRGFFLDRDFVWADPGHCAEFNRSYSSPGELASYLKSKGITHALVNFAPWTPGRENATGVWAILYAAIDEGYFEEVFAEGDYQPRVAVYQVR